MSKHEHAYPPEAPDLGPGSWVEDRWRHLTWEGHHQDGWTHPHTVWTLTTGRTGTTWLAQVLNSLRGLDAIHEPPPTPFLEHRLHQEDGSLSAMSSDEQREHGMCARMLRALRGHAVVRAYEDRNVYVECSRGWVFLAGCLREAFPRARFVHLTRDPRAYVASALPRGWMNRERSIQGFWWPETCPEAEPHRRLLWQWSQVTQEALRLEREWGGDRVHRLRAEDMWTDATYLVDLAKFCGLRESFNVRLRHHLRAWQDRPINASDGSPTTHGRNRWDPAWEADLQELVPAPVLAELGYSNTGT